MDYFNRYKHFIGGRILKTGIAVFLTALICDLLNWPAGFAVIAAIVTIEPTAAHSIKKAYVRFPATAIGAAYSIVFYVALGNTPVTYTLVAIATIVTCHKLHLNDGTLVATLTGIAMIATVEDHFVASFFTRLGTTTIGLTVSTLVNFFVLRPNYSPTISSKIHGLFIEAGDILEKSGLEILRIESSPKSKGTKVLFQELLNNIEKIEVLCSYQKEEWKYHRIKRQEKRVFHYEYKKLNILRQITYHAGNFITISSQDVSIEKEKADLIMNTIKSINRILHHNQYEIDEEHHILVNELIEQFWHERPQTPPQYTKTIHHCFSSDTIFLYELISINDLLEVLNQVHTLELRHQ